jgi:hypothetical protein
MDLRQAITAICPKLDNRYLARLDNRYPTATDNRYLAGLRITVIRDGVGEERGL